MAYDMFLNGCLELLAVYGSEIILIQIHPGSGTKVEAVRAQDQHLGTFLIRIPMRRLLLILKVRQLSLRFHGLGHDSPKAYPLSLRWWPREE